MNKKELKRVMDSLGVLAEAVVQVQVAIGECVREDAPEVKEEAETNEEVKMPTPETITKVMVRTKLSELSSAGKTAEVKELLQKHGAKNLSSLKEEDYAAVMKEAEEL